MATKKTTKKDTPRMLYLNAGRCNRETVKTVAALAKIDQGFLLDKDDLQAIVNDCTATTIKLLFLDCNALIRRPDGQIIRTNLVPVEEQAPVDSDDECEKDTPDEIEQPKKKGFFGRLKDKFKKD